MKLVGAGLKPAPTVVLKSYNLWYSSKVLSELQITVVPANPGSGLQGDDCVIKNWANGPAIAIITTGISVQG